MTMLQLLCVKQFPAQKFITKMEHPPYSPDLVPNGFWLTILVCLKGTKISDVEDILKDVSTALKFIPQQEFPKCLGPFNKLWLAIISFRQLHSHTSHFASMSLRWCQLWRNPSPTWTLS
jgi:hypothetical protein